MGLIIIIALGVVLGLLLFNHGKTILGVIAIAIIIVLFKQSAAPAAERISCTGPMHSVIINKQQFDEIKDGERICRISWGTSGHDPLRGECDYDEMCTISGSYIRSGHTYVLGNDWNAIARKP